VLKCNSKNPKFKNLTIGKDYEGTLDGDFAEVVNDAGVKSKYHKKYFSEVTEETEVSETRLSLNDILDRLNITVSGEEDERVIQVVYNSGAKVALSTFPHDLYKINSYVYVESAQNTCGILELDGMNNIADLTSSIIRDLNTSTILGFRVYTGQSSSDVTESELFNAIMIRVLDYISEEHSEPFYMLTTNSPDSSIFSVFTEKVTNTYGCFRSLPKENPNSGNDIAVWLIDIAEFFRN